MSESRQTGESVSGRKADIDGVKMVPSRHRPKTARKASEHRLPRSRSSNRAPQAERILPKLLLKKILVPVDFSKASARALSYAASLLEPSEGRIVLLHVTPTVRVSLDCGYGQVDRDLPDDGQIRRDSQKLQRFAIKHISRPILAGALIRAGPPAEEIARVAKDENVDMIILSAHAEGIPSPLRCHETVEGVIRRASCPVFVVRPPNRGA
jgi:nucleotide-binding universal stress UspA family protein